MATVFVPTPLRRLTGGESKVAVEASTVQEVIEQLESAHPGVKERLLDEDGEIKRFINVFVDGEEIRGLQGGETPVNERSEVSIIPAMAGGRTAVGV
ncbi:MAG: MoaD/ThiS family protein [Chloroflexota bacterium]|nr:MoaD/ThiS family protein [Chloroflexota bacterium]